MNYGLKNILPFKNDGAILILENYIYNNYGTL